MIRILLSLCTAFFITACYAQTGKSCRLPDGGSGVCKSILECHRLMKLINKAMEDSQVMADLQRLKCGPPGSIEVCCSDCYTPDGVSGVCQNLYSCPSLQTMLSATPQSPQFNFIMNSICNTEDQQSFCCGPTPREVRKGQCTNQVFPVDPTTECCGIAATAESRIVGGNDTAIDAYPWLALLEYKPLSGTKLQLRCGGTLISGKYVVTAAHCIKGSAGLVPPVSVRLGEYDTENEGKDCIEDDDCTEPYVSIPIEKIEVHIEYSTQTNRNDIALIRLQNAAPYTEFIRPICLPTAQVPDENLSSLKVYAAGWGKVSWNINHSRVKQHVQLPIMNTQQCQDAYGRAAFSYKLWSRQLCAGGERGKDTCNGDSGGPLMLVTPNANGVNVYTLAGVVSFGPRQCGTAGVPGVYTRVYNYNAWIRARIEH